MSISLVSTCMLISVVIEIMLNLLVFYQKENVMPVAPELNKNQIKRVSNCFTGTRHEHRDRCYFFMLLYSGMRVGEPIQLKNEDVIDWDGNIKESTIITLTKNGKSRRVYFPKNLHKYISAYWSNKGDVNQGGNLYFFQSQQSPMDSMSLVNATRLIKNSFNRAGLPEFSSHSLRRSNAMFLRREVGLDLEVIREVLGHNDIRTTQRYFAASSIEASEGLSQLSF